MNEVHEFINDHILVGETQKHAKHDQKSHGNWAGNKGGSGGGDKGGGDGAKGDNKGGSGGGNVEKPVKRGDSYLNKGKWDPDWSPRQQRMVTEAQGDIGLAQLKVQRLQEEYGNKKSMRDKYLSTSDDLFDRADRAEKKGRGMKAGNLKTRAEKYEDLVVELNDWLGGAGHNQLVGAKQKLQDYIDAHTNLIEALEKGFVRKKEMPYERSQ